MLIVDDTLKPSTGYINVILNRLTAQHYRREA